MKKILATIAVLLVGVCAGWARPAAVTESPAPPFHFPGTPTAIYSTRKVVAVYTGRAVNIRRAIDNATMDIGFAGHDFDVASASSFCASTICYVTRWYDQSGHAQDAMQPALVAQPYLLLSGGRAWVAFAGTFLQTASAVDVNGDQTIGVVMTTGDGHALQVPVSDFDGSAGWFLDVNGGSTVKEAGYYSSGKREFINGPSNLVAHAPSRLAINRMGEVLNIFVNGSHIITASHQSNTAPSVGMTIGGYNSTPSSLGLISEVFVYSSALSNAERLAIDANEASYWHDFGFETPYAGSSWVQFSATDYASVGNVLDYERTQPWTVFAAVQLYSGGLQPQVIFSNVPAGGSAFAGYELWVDQAGRLRCRIIHDYEGGDYLDVHGSTNLWDGKKHFLAATYDGSSRVAGIKFYIDGKPERVTTVLDKLTGSIIAPRQSFFIGAQNGGASLLGMLGHFQIDNVVRSPSYIASHSAPSSLPPIDANTVISIPFAEGSGTVAHDASGNKRNATLSSASLWVP